MKHETKFQKVLLVGYEQWVTNYVIVNFERKF